MLDMFKLTEWMLPLFVHLLWSYCVITEVIAVLQLVINDMFINQKTLFSCS